MKDPARVFLNIECSESEKKLHKTRLMLIIGCSVLGVITLVFYVFLYKFSNTIKKANATYYSKQVSVAAFTL